MITRLITTLILTSTLAGCNKSDYFKAYAVSSPKRDKCLTFVGEYNSDDIIKNNQFYLLGYNPQGVNRQPDSNYLLIQFFDDLDGISVVWDSLTILVSKDKVIQNNLTGYKVVYYEDLVDSQMKDLETETYWFQGVHRDKYDACDLKGGQ
jgi:hypothetical protein